MEKYRILLLGPPTVLLGKAQVKIQRQTTRALLYYLACSEAPLNRLEAASLFWPDTETGLVRRRLREILSKIRKDLPDPNLIVSYQDQVRLDPTRVMVDVLEFYRLHNQTRSVAQSCSTETPLPHTIAQKMSQAVNLWRSPRFLAGANLPSTEEFDRWVSTTSSHLETLRLNMIERLVDHSIANRVPHEALNWLRQALEIEETNSVIHYRILDILVRLGQTSEAIKHIHDMKNIWLMY